MQFRFRRPNAVNAYESFFLMPYVYLFCFFCHDLFRKNRVGMDQCVLALFALVIVIIDVVTIMTVISGDLSLFIFVSIDRLAMYVVTGVMLFVIMSPPPESAEYDNLYY